jgi:putative oxidoreductase
MNQLTSIGKFLYLIPFFFFGVGHLTGANDMKGMVPSYLPGGVLWVYLTGLAMLGFVVATMLGKFDKLAAVLLAIMLIIFACVVHLPQQGTNPMWMIGFVKDIGLAGGALMIADKYARDNSIIG